MNLERLQFLHQIHSNYGIIVTQEQKFEPFKKDGDYLVSDVKRVGIGVMTADCLPIIIYSPLCPAVGIVHAGWRGSMQQVAVAAVEHMQRSFGIELSNIRIFFGPSAKRCCYEVGDNVLNELNYFSFKDEVVIHRGDKVYFDVPLFNKLQLLDLGISKEAFHTIYNNCTICDDSFCSYRRDKGFNRQMTVVALK